MAAAHLVEVQHEEDVREVAEREEKRRGVEEPGRAGASVRKQAAYRVYEVQFLHPVETMSWLFYVLAPGLLGLHFYVPRQCRGRSPRVPFVRMARAYVRNAGKWRSGNQDDGGLRPRHERGYG